ncbi:T9SS type A sorting domain-containing protein [bacterium]|nr:T9SS type A sorting domain-containing protein [bacterium]
MCRGKKSTLYQLGTFHFCCLVLFQFSDSAAQTLRRIGPPGAYFSDITFSADNSDIIYSATYGDGIYKSIDQGLTWENKSNGLQYYHDVGAYRAIESIHCALGRSDTLIAVTPIDPFGEFWTFFTPDGGNNWSSYGSPWKKFWVSPATPGLFIARRNPTYRSTDYGETWEDGFVFYWSKILQHPSDAQKLYFSSIDSFRVSEDAGLTLVDGLGGRVGLKVVSPVFPYTLFGESPNYEPGQQGDDYTLVYSDDEGFTWNALLIPEGCLDDQPEILIIDAEGYLYIAAEHPVLHGYESALHRTLDNGNNWERLTGADGIPLEKLAIPPDNVNHFIGVTRNQSMVISRDGGETFQLGGNGTFSSSIINIERDPADDRILYAATIDNHESMLSEEHSRTLMRRNEVGNWSIIYNGVFYRMMTNPLLPGYLFLWSNREGFILSSDNGDTWQAWAEIDTAGFKSIPLYLDFEFNPEDSARCWIGAHEVLYDVGEFGTEVTEIYQFEDRILDVEVDSLDQNRIYVLTTPDDFELPDFRADLWISDDGGESFTLLQPTLSRARIQLHNPSGLLLISADSYEHGTRFYIFGRNHENLEEIPIPDDYRLYAFYESWLPGNEPGLICAFLSSHNEEKIAISSDIGQNWHIAADIFPWGYFPRDMEFRDDGETVYVADSYSGITEVSLNLNALDETHLQLPPQNPEIRIYPNPTNSSVTVQFNLEQPFSVYISLYSIMGKLILEEKHWFSENGFCKYEVDLSSISSGVYLLRANTSKQILDSQKLVIIK